MAEGKVAFANTLRGPAALSVVAYHYLGIFWSAHSGVVTLIGMPLQTVDPPAYAGFIEGPGPFNWGQFGVGLFFVISGFVIPFSFSRYSRVGFAIARFFRLWPTYAVGFLLTIAVIYLGDRLAGGTFPYSARDIAIHALLGLRAITLSPSIDGIIWTLEIEITFYLVCIVIAPGLRSGHWSVFLTPLVLFVVCLGLARWNPATPLVAQIKTIVGAHAEYIIFMFTGVAFNFLHRARLSTKVAFAIAAASVAAFLVLLAIGGVGAYGWSYAAAVLTFCAAMIWQKWIPDGPVWRFLSDISYPLYVIHALAGYMLMELMLRAGVFPSLAVAGTSAIVFFCAWLIHVCLEMPTHNLGRDLARGHRAQPGKTGTDAMRAGAQAGVGSPPRPT